VRKRCAPTRCTGQGIKAAGPRVIIDGFRPRIGHARGDLYQDAPGFTLRRAVASQNGTRGMTLVSGPLFERFGAAAQAWADKQNNKRMLEISLIPLTT